MLQTLAAGHRAGCDHVALGRHGQPRRWLDEADGYGAPGPEIGAAARAGRGHGAVGSHRQVRTVTTAVREPRVLFRENIGDIVIVRRAFRAVALTKMFETYEN